MRSLSRRFIAGYVALLVLAACTSVQPFRVTGESIDKAGSVFLMVAKTYDAAYDSKLVTAAQYNAWKAFGLEFQKDYRPAVAAWKTAVAANNALLEQQTNAKISGLIAALAQHGTVVGVRVMDLITQN